MHAHEQITCTTMATWNFTPIRCQNRKGHTKETNCYIPHAYAAVLCRPCLKKKRSEMWRSNVSAQEAILLHFDMSHMRTMLYWSVLVQKTDLAQINTALIIHSETASLVDKPRNMCTVYNNIKQLNSNSKHSTTHTCSHMSGAVRRYYISSPLIWESVGRVFPPYRHLAVFVVWTVDGTLILGDSALGGLGL